MSLGAEAAAHVARTYLHHFPPDHILVNLDFKNAFNTIKRDEVLEAARESIPELFPLKSSLVTPYLPPFSFTRRPCNRLRGSGRDH